MSTTKGYADDFFAENTSPPKQTAKLRAARRPPPPPPKPGSSTATPGAASSPSRRGPTASRPPAAASAAARTSRTLPTVKKAPSAAGRPLGNYYLSGGGGGGGTGGTNSNSGSSNSSSSNRNSGVYSQGTSSVNDWTASSAPQSNSTAAISSKPAFGSWAAPPSHNQAPAAKTSSVPSSNEWFTPVTDAGGNAAANGTVPGQFGSQTNSNSNNGIAAGSTADSNTATNMYAPSESSSSGAGGFNYSGYTGMNTHLHGSMDDSHTGVSTSATNESAHSSYMRPQTFIPDPGSVSGTGMGSTSSMSDDFENEPPLLEELGIVIPHIVTKTKAVVLPFQRFGGDQLDPAAITQDADMAGPLAFAILLGFEMSLSGKLQFGYIYGFGLFGCLSMTLVINLMSPTEPVSFWTVTSVLGYSLIPVNVLALAKIFIMNLIRLQTLGRLLGLLTVAWSTTASTRLLEVGCNMRDQRYLVAYPIALLYSAFVLITIF